MTDFPNLDLLARIPLAARTVLDVGCGSGALGAAYRRLNPRARILGIEKDLDQAERAAMHLDDVVAADVEEELMPFELPEGLDCIIYGDVLEHLREPWKVLRAHAETLSPEGMMLICVPNAEHWSFAARLLRGDWDYEASGLFDEGHLRWFTLETMRKGLAALGLVLCDAHPRIFAREEAEAFVRTVAPALQALGIDPAAYLGRASPLQYILRVRVQPRTLMSVAATMLKPIGGVSDHRVIYPMRALATDPAVVPQIGRSDDPRMQLPDGPRIFVFHRPILSGEQGLQTIRDLLRRDFVIVTEFDDHPDFFEAMRQEDQFAFSAVHAVQTSTLVLGEVLRQRNPEIAVFPNAIPMLPEIRNFSEGQPFTIFFGALNREGDWQPFMPVLNELAVRFGATLRFRIVHDKSMFDALATPHKSFTPTCDHDTYMTLLGSCEASFMPLLDTLFNRAKSDLKFIEAAASRVVSIASRVVYAETLEDGRTGLLFDSPEELRRQLLFLLNEREAARGIADAARDYVAQERMLAYQVAPRIAWYRSLWERRAELDAALRARVPALA